MEDNVFFENKIAMERLQYKAKLVSDCSYIFTKMAERSKVLPLGFMRKTRRTVMRDFNKGLRIINKRIPVYVELPSFKSYDNGMYQKVNPATKKPISDEVEVNTADLQALQELKDMKSVVEYDENF